jgi:tRNA/rRNA methyltransferase
MYRLEVAVMEPKYQQNLGYIARVSKNFGVRKLVLIAPRCNHNGKQAIKYSKHASDMLKNATILKRLKDLKSDFLIGTTGIWHKTNASYYNIYNVGEIARLAKRAGHADKSITLLLGRDDTGLSRDELKLCDATVFIRASKDYPILNISHALAILLNGLQDADNGNYRFMDSVYADARSQEDVFRLFEGLLKRNPRIRDRKSVSMAFRHIVRRSVPTKKELSALSIALAGSKSKNK